MVANKSLNLTAKTQRFFGVSRKNGKFSQLEKNGG